MAYGLVIPRYKQPEASTYAPATSRGSLDVLRGMYRKIVRFYYLRTLILHYLFGTNGVSTHS